jgi:peptidoglycan/xylan/chitin deacetylase (PgdA/CDA1 family)
LKLTRRQFLKFGGAAILWLAVPGRGQAQAVRIPVLLYHELSIHPGEEETVPPSLFASQMEWLYGMGFQAISFDEVDSLDADRARRSVIITFDDGPASFMDHAFPLLAEYGFKATVTVIGNQVNGVVSGHDPSLSWDECRFLVKSGIVEIGCHTNALHVWGRGSSPALTLAAFNEKLGMDLAAFQDRYRREMGRTATVLAWPYGRYDRKSIEIAKQEGFRYLLTSDRGFFEKGGDRSAVPRWPVNHDTDLPAFRDHIERRT